MKVWESLYRFFWLAVLQVVIGVLLASGVATSPVVPLVHGAIGGAVVVWAFVNFRAVRATRAPGRTKRTVAATFAISILMIPLGLLLFFGVGNGVGVYGFSANDAIGIVHLVFALAIVTQAASTATGFDMWEEREFEHETEPGAIPFSPEG
jgi:hypothetical protein